MGSYLPGITIRQAHENMVETTSGSLWAYYVLDGLNIGVIDPNSIQRATASHNRLLTALSKISGAEWSLHSMKKMVGLDDVMNKIGAGLPKDYTPAKYPYLTKKIAALENRISSGALRQFDRQYILAIRMGNPTTLQEGFMSMFVRKDTVSTVDLKDMEKTERKIFALIPREFHPRKGTMRDLRWAAERASFRGLKVPMEPSTNTLVPGPDSFPSIAINPTADTEAMLDSFIAKYVDDDPALVTRAKDKYRTTYRTLSAGRAISVANVDTRNEFLPDGMVSYQAHIVVDKYPMRRGSLQTFTHMVDLGISDLDCDWTIRGEFDPMLLSRDNIKKLQGAQRYRTRTSTDEYEDAELAETNQEMAEFHELPKGRTSQIPFKLTTMFHFASPDLDNLTERMEETIKWFEDVQDYTVRMIPGGQRDMYQQSLPCIPHSKLTKAYAQATTIKEFSPAVPIRTTHTGDLVGWPTAVNKSDINGRFVYFDWLGRPDRGNPSMLVPGAMGSGKSYSMKSDLSILAAYHSVCHVIDPSAHGEYEAFAKTLENQDPAITTQTINLANGTHSFDPIKLYGDNEELLRMRFARITLPMLGLRPDSAAAAVIMGGLTESARRTYGVRSTRDLFEKYLSAHADAKSGTEEGKELHKAKLRADYISMLPYGRGLIDPKGVDVPVINVSAPIIVFRNYGLSVRKAGESLDVTDIEKWVSEYLLNSVALFTSTRFARTKKVCATLGDEMSFLANSPDILDELVNKPVRMGRKESNLLIAGTQDAGDLGDEFKTISIHTIMRQEGVSAAERAIELASLPYSEALVDNIINDTSPREPGGSSVIRGREGEAWYTDSISPPARIKRLPMLLTDENEAANTTASKLREE